MFEINTATYTPDNFIAGEFPIAKEVLNVAQGVTIGKYAPVKLVDGTANVVPYIAEDETYTAAENTAEGLYGIAAEASSGGQVVVYVTGEFFGAALNLEENVTAALLKPAFRNLGVFLK
jgi:hypothetical protein